MQRALNAGRSFRDPAHTDSLTGLANRVTLREAMTELLAGGRSGGLLMVDLDHFKAVNDSLGHSAPDEVLKTGALRLRGCVRRTIWWPGSVATSSPCCCPTSAGRARPPRWRSA